MFGDEWAPLATMADAHREWHLNTGTPMGQAGCPQDACHPDLDDDYEQEPPTAEMLAEMDAWRDMG